MRCLIRETGDAVGCQICRGQEQLTILIGEKWIRLRERHNASEREQTERNSNQSTIHFFPSEMFIDKMTVLFEQ